MITVLFLLLLFHSSSNAAVYNNVSVHGGYNISHYLSNIDMYFVDDSIFQFMDGVHVIEQEVFVVINGVHNLTFIGSSFIDVFITCVNNTGGFAFMNITDLHISGITLTGCGVSPDISIDLEPNSNTSQFLLNLFEYLVTTSSTISSTFLYNMSVFMININGLYLDNFSITNGSGFGLIAINAFDVLVTNSVFSRNNYNSISKCRDSFSTFNCNGGNVVFAYTDIWIPSNINDTNIFPLTIENTKFSFGCGLNIANSYDYFTGGGITIYMEQTNCYGINVTLNGVISHGNNGPRGSNIIFVTRENLIYYYLTIINTSSLYSNWLFKEPGWEHMINLTTGGGLTIILGIAFADNATRNIDCVQPETLAYPVYITNSNFTDNTAVLGAGVFITVYSAPPQLQIIKFQCCNLNNNNGYLGIALYIDQVPYTTFGSSIEYSLDKVSMSQSNLFSPPHLELEDNGTAIFMNSLQKVSCNNIVVTDNTPNAGALISNSIIVFSGNNEFTNNQARRGGAVNMYGTTYFVLVVPANLSFINNHALEEGGAVFIDQTSSLTKYCFFQVQDIDYSQYSVSAKWTFINNTASIAGSAIYGGTITQCTLLTLSDLTTFNTSQQVFDSTFNLIEQVGQSVVSSDPFQVCFCSNNSQYLLCNRTALELVASPGSTIVLPLATVGNREGLSIGVIEVKVLNDSFLVSSQSSCTLHSFTVPYDSSGSVTFKFSVHPSSVRINTIVKYPTITANVGLLPCPLGFELSPVHQSTCQCDSILVSEIHHLTCNISTSEITRQDNVWIGYDNQLQCILIDTRCPYDYCVSSSVTFNITQPDPQCALNRTGILCGQCAEGLSLMLGTNQCGECTNDYIALIIPFALAGIALVAFLIALNLTVSVGTINGLIFYANVIKIKETVFFPNGPVPFLSQFIAWINLDFGIQTCFFNGFDSYAKAWLQFLFPLYIWILILICIILCKYSTRLSRLIGQNVLPTFATLILLSYTKLFRAVIPIIQFTYTICYYDNNSTVKLTFWAPDAGIPYFSPQHLILWLFAIFVFCFIFVPYTLFLFVSSFCYSYCHGNKCSSVNLRLKPVCDAYYGPYKTSLRLWTSLLLIARLVLVIVSAVTDGDVYISVAITIIAIVFGIFSAARGIYRRKWLNYIESWFLFNLLILLAVTKVLPYYSTIVSISIAFLTFAAIAMYHFSFRFRNFICLKNLFSKQNSIKKEGNVNGIAVSVSKNSSLMCSLVEDKEVVIDHNNVPTTVVERYHRRESLIYDNDNSTDYVSYDDSTGSLLHS